MHSYHDKKSDPFYKLPASKPASSKIVNEARNALSTVGTQRPFTPREDIRKLFGSSSSRTQDNRPPSSFSLDACNFEYCDSRPVSGTRLRPLSNKPKLPLLPPEDTESAPRTPHPPLHPMLAKRSSIGRRRLLEPLSQGTLVSDCGNQPEEGKKQESTEGSSHISRVHLEDNIPISGSQQALNESDNTEHLQKLPEQNISLEDDSRCGPCGRRCSPPLSHSHQGSSISGIKAGFESEQVRGTEQETETEINLWVVKVFPILQELDAACNDKNVEDLCCICAKLHKCLEDGNMLGKQCIKRASILKTLYRLIEIGSDKLNLRLSGLILALKVSGKNLLSICKVLFKISRNENNDDFFQNYNILGYLLEVLQNEDVRANSEAFLYCMAAIKFLSGNTALLNDLLKKQAVEILVALMKQIITYNAAPGTSSPNIGHLLVQLTATLRNLADLPQSRQMFLESNALSDLCLLMEHFVCDEDICTNISRILSKLSSYNDCCTTLIGCARCYPALLAVLRKHPNKQDLVVRIFYTLGNLTAKNNKAREQLYEEKGSIKTLLGFLHTYIEFDINSEQKKYTENTENTTERMKDSKRPSEIEDVLVKLIRLLANMSIYSVIGKDLAANQSCVTLLMLILDYKSVEKCEELLINTVAAINNLSYYQDCPSIIIDRRLQISQLLLKLLLCNNMDAILETTRVFGNLSHYQDVCDFIVARKIYKFMVTLLDAKHQDVCFSACGVLVNLNEDRSKRALLKQDGGIKKLADCLRDFGPSDWQLAGLVCKALWNFSENITEAQSCFGHEETHIIMELLSSFLDEEIALHKRWNDDLMEYHKTYWEEEFKPVASQLLERIQTHYSSLEPLPI
ncbi:armadillo repeat-containing protein 2 [Bombina bombina]|uniref:armadillo repeat-containing protein 2 n=1 Tax=Bombina bombina TaxID=8345 RepID=UPI00235A6962|nr:armadillo repeat-containing protein 2 [Bombina bombina]